MFISLLIFYEQYITEIECLLNDTLCLACSLCTVAQLEGYHQVFCRVGIEVTPDVEFLIYASEIISTLVNNVLR